MPRSEATARAGEMLNDLKSRLGFSKGENRISARDSYDDFGEYDDFDDDGFSASNDREYAGYGADYDENAPVGGFRPATTRSSRFGRPDSTPDLVSISDVKARSQVSGATLQPSGRNLVESSGPAYSSPAYNAQLRNREARSRSEGLDSLFEPTSSTSASARVTTGSGSYAGAGSSTRGLTVIRPLAYGDVEQVSRSLKAGDVVVLAMATTPASLSTRVLDFAFGVASALDASVECPAEKVFAIARGQAITEDEKSRLRIQGVL